MKKLLIANRGDIALTIIRAAKNLGLGTVAIFSEADRGAPHAKQADEAYCVGPAPALESYLHQENILAVLQQCGADAVHPGYGFLSENPTFAEAVTSAGAIFVGPPTEAMKRLGHKDAARKIAEAAGVPVVPGYHGEAQDEGTLLKEISRIGFPCLIKARAGGGGKGMRLVTGASNLQDEIAAAKREAMAAFGDDRVILERCIEEAQHIEVQLIADTHGHIVHLYERDCSLQRRHQKVIEEAPAPTLDPDLREQIVHAAKSLASAAGLVNASTVEFLVPLHSKKKEFYFLEVNCRVQVEHPVTELITGIDIVELQLRVARGEKIPFAQKDVSFCGAAVEARLYAELPAQGFIPATGTVRATNLAALQAEGVRIDHALEAGVEITTFYDPMLAKVICYASSREIALSLLDRTLEKLYVRGLETNQAFLRELLAQSCVSSGTATTAFIDANLESLTTRYSTQETCQHALAIFLHEIHANRGASKANPFVSAVSDAPSATFSSDQERRFNVPTLPYRIKSNASGKTSILEARPISLRLSDNSLSCEIAGQRVEVRAKDDGGYEINQKPTRGWINLERNQRSPAPLARVELFGETCSIQPQIAGDETDHENADTASEVRSPLPGKLVRVDATPGQSVQAGEPLCVIESMKMEHALRAPRDVVIDEVLLQPGDSVNEGQRIISFVQS